jgi:hypothetical protein
MNHFSYHSEQVHSDFHNGKGQTRRNVVDVKNGKGTKSVEVYDASGKVKNRKEKVLTDTELSCIKRNQFIPGLFKDCVKPLPLAQGKARARHSRTHKRRTAK